MRGLPKKKDLPLTILTDTSAESEIVKLDIYTLSKKHCTTSDKDSNYHRYAKLAGPKETDCCSYYAGKMLGNANAKYTKACALTAKLSHVRYLTES